MILGIFGVRKVFMIGIFLTVFGQSPITWADHYALLIGISTYLDKNINSLEGPRHDVAALREILSTRWGFAANQIVTLIDGEATRARILQELHRLKDRSQPGDTLFLYFSGHGTSSHGAPDLPIEAHSGALVPVDFRYEGTPAQSVQNLIVGRRDLRPLLMELDQADRRVFVVFDACYSGNTVRSLHHALLAERLLAARHIALHGPVLPTRAPEQNDMSNDIGAFGQNTYKQEAYPYHRIFYLSAASEFEVASDIGAQNLGRYSTVDNRPHGALTDALLRVLGRNLQADTNHDGRLTFGEVYRSVADFMRQRQYGHTPQALPTIVQDREGLAEQSVFPQTGQPSAPPRIPAMPPVLRVRLAADLPALKQALGQVSEVMLTEERPDLVVQKEGDALWLVTGAGDLLVRLEKPTDEQLVRRVRQQARVRKWVATSNPEQCFNLSLALSRRPLVAGGAEANVKTSLGGAAFVGDKISFAVRSEQPAYLLLLDIDPLGGIHVLYPFDDSELKLLPAGQVIEIPGARPDDWIRVEPPLGTEYVLALAFTSLREELKTLMGQNFQPDSPLLDKIENLLATPARDRAQTTLQLVTVLRGAMP